MNAVDTERVQVILVGGIGGEVLGLPFVGSYMHCLKPLVRKLLPRSRVFVIQPPIYQSIQKTSDDIAMIVRDGFFFHGLKTIVIGHSRGGIEALLAVTKNPDLIRLGMIQGLIPMNSPFRGSPVADKICDWLIKIGLRWQALDEIRTRFRHIEPIDKLFLDEPELREKLLKRTLFVQAEVDDSQGLPLALKLSRPIVNRVNSANDGLVPHENQIPEWFSTNRVTVKGHHGYFTCTGLISKSSEDQKMEVLANCLSKVIRTAAEGVGIPSEEKVKRVLKVATYNVGMLKIPVWGVPYPNTRWRAICDALASRSYDIIFFQELFGTKARQELETRFPDYYVAKGPDRPMNGLVTLVNRSLVKAKGDIAIDYQAFRKQRKWEGRVGFEKGFLTCHLKVPGIISPLTFINLHLTAFASAFKLRREQRLEVLEHCYRLDVLGLAENVILGGDFNDSLRWQWSTVDPTFSVNGELHRLKSYLNREKASMHIDYLIAFSKFKTEGIVYDDIGIDLADHRVEIQRRSKRLSIELSDHQLVHSTFKITEGRVASADATIIS